MVVSVSGGGGGTSSSTSGSVIAACTAGSPRYALRTDFAVMFDPTLQGEALEKAIAAFQTTHLSKSALARVSIMMAGAAGSAAGVLVTFPHRETRQLAPGPSSIIAQAVVEVFAPRSLETPAVLWLSESGNKIVVRDDRIVNAIGLQIEADKNLPDLTGRWRCECNASMLLVNIWLRSLLDRHAVDVNGAEIAVRTFGSGFAGTGA